METIKVQVANILELASADVYIGHHVYLKEEVHNLLKKISKEIMALEEPKQQIDFTILKDELIEGIVDAVKHSIDWDGVIDVSLDNKTIELSVDEHEVINELKGVIIDTLETAQETLNNA